MTTKGIFLCVLLNTIQANLYLFYRPPQNEQRIEQYIFIITSQYCRYSFISFGHLKTQ